MSLTYATRQLLDSIRYRTDARLRGAAVLVALQTLNPDEIEEPPDFDIPKQSEPFALSAETALQALPYQTGTLAADAWELLWSELTEALVEHQEAQYDGLEEDVDRLIHEWRAEQRGR
jgi:hypothetical protein